MLSNGKDGATSDGSDGILSLTRQQQIFDRVVQHSCLREHPVKSVKRQAFVENLVKIALEGDAASELYEPLAEATVYGESDSSSFFYRSFHTQNCPTSRAEASTVRLRCTDTFGGVAETSVKVWPAGIVLGRFLGTRNDLGGKRIVEFGCGTGAVGVMALKALAEDKGEVSHRRHPSFPVIRVY